MEKLGDGSIAELAVFLLVCFYGTLYVNYEYTIRTVGCHRCPKIAVERVAGASYRDMAL